ncbi:MAG TPA: sigma 54-interacting transcriptional regulator [Candidatus Polarisedimenticolia bacterium]|nr:sigma 54-interacting transcriptional regulator [Candidatus Polarisedimenticolia bacterium]
MENINKASTIVRDCAEDKFEEIIGNSTGLKFVLTEVQRVAPTDSTVLVLGETGTGKERIAGAIHKTSTRRDRPFIKLNCAAIPFDLLESELFGYEKGAFTGAFAQKIGRFEMADTGTLFLDEIGDIPLALQPKLLRVLQEKEFERLGSGKTHRINVRLVTATHRNLEEMVARHQFRSDLYYRLNVFPIMLPPLRERREDIPLLVSHFVEVFSRRMGKQISSIPRETLDAFTSYSWPGNVRELQNLIERAVILSEKGVLANPFSTVDGNLLGEKPTNANFVVLRPAQEDTFWDSQRAVILRALDASGWIVGGLRGAAARLGLKRTTLISKMRKLGISRPVRKHDIGRLTENRESEQWWQPTVE